MSAFYDETFFCKLNEIAASQSLPLFRQALTVNNKEVDGFDPVTMADQQTEAALRAFLQQNRPQDGILGEEGGIEGGEREFVWVIDPIDGTRAFISGLPVWGTLVGLLHKGDAIAGMMAQPFTGELFFANDEGSFLRHNGSTQMIKCRDTTHIKDATLFSTAPQLLKGKEGESFACLEEKAQLTRFGTDCYAFAMLAAGFVDLVVEVGLKPYDIVALIPIIEKAGGVISRWDGGRAEEAGNIVAAATPQLHEKAMEILAKAI
ncbi:histidinol-phosphatase [Bartonella sp. HY038]|uniref:histidinol-phosphatase n=1 Tax=Bartonella sp. HY038 TaxID=2759660 RepID=UPI0015FCC52B|nr:histidinol-phosphatase [Bartonella sp. HY038]